MNVDYSRKIAHVRCIVAKKREENTKKKRRAKKGNRIYKTNKKSKKKDELKQNTRYSRSSSKALSLYRFILVRKKKIIASGWFTDHSFCDNAR